MMDETGWPSETTWRNRCTHEFRYVVHHYGRPPWEAEARLRVLRGSVSRWKTEIERKTREVANQKETRSEEGGGGLGQLCDAELGPVPATQSPLLSCWLAGIASLTMQGKFYV